MFGMVNDRIAPDINRTAGKIQVYLQKSLIIRPTKFEPTTLPILPVIIEIETAIALKMHEILIFKNWTRGIFLTLTRSDRAQLLMH